MVHGREWRQRTEVSRSNAEQGDDASCLQLVGPHQARTIFLTEIVEKARTAQVHPFEREEPCILMD